MNVMPVSKLHLVGLIPLAAGGFTHYMDLYAFRLYIYIAYSG